LPLQNLERLQQQQSSNKVPEVVPFVNGSHQSGVVPPAVPPVIPQEMSSSSKRTLVDVLDVKEAKKKENHDHVKNAEKSEDANKNKGNDNQQAEAAKKAVDREI